MQKRTLIIMMFLVSGISIGCSDKGGGAGKTPKRTLTNMKQAMLDGNGEKFADCFDAGVEEKEALISLCRFSHALSKMQKALIDEYGSGSPQVNFNPQMDKIRDKNWLDQLTVKVTGDSAQVSQSGSSQFIMLVRKDDLWRISAGAMMPMADSERVKKMAKKYSTMANVCKKIIKKIGSKGYTEEKAHQELMDVMAQELITITPSGKGQSSRQSSAAPQQSGKGVIKITPSPKKNK